MTKINVRGKGSAGEREFCKWLQLNLSLSFLPERNLEQVRDGGADVMSVTPFAFEVKRCQGLALRDWWLQVSIACRGTDNIPVVVFRQNNQPWRFLISAKNIGLDVGFVQLEEKEAIQWIKLIRNQVSN